MNDREESGREPKLATWCGWQALPFDLWLAAQLPPPQDPLLEYYSRLVAQPSPHKGEAMRRRDMLEILQARRAA